MPMPLTPKRRIEGALVKCLMTLFGALPVDRASSLGGWIARHIGPFTGIHRKAIRQMAEFLPNRTDAEIEKLAQQMWDNLGRTVAEYPHLAEIGRTRVTVDNRAGFTRETLNATPAIFIGGHFANWEIAGATLDAVMQTRADLVYRAPNNSIVDTLLNTYRSLNGKLTTIPKSRAGMRAIVEALRDGHKIGILIDQKYNEGIAVPFFGKMAMTSTAFAQMGQRFNCPVYPTQIIRENGAHFRIIAHKPLELRNADGMPRELYDVAVDANNLIEEWMREHPEQWLWVHQRWSSRAVKETDEPAETLDDIP